MAVPESGKGSKKDQQKDKGKQKPKKGQKGAQDDKEAELSEEVGAAVIDCCSSRDAQADGST